MLQTPGTVRPSRRTLKRTRAIALGVVVGPAGASVVGLAFAWRYRWIGPLELGLFAFFYAISGLGITLGFHRFFSHRSFVASRPLQVALAIAGSMAAQGPLIRWVADHRRHHRFSDQAGDPHSPQAGEVATPVDRLKTLWWAHIGWMFDSEKTLARFYAPDLLGSSIAKWVDRHYVIWMVASLGLPAACGWVLGGSYERALSAAIVAGAFRILLFQHVTWCVNSVCHWRGARPYPTNDQSANNPLLGLLVLGEGWHNNHHAFPRSARHGLETYQIDLTWIALRGFCVVGLARDPRVPSKEQRARTCGKRAPLSPSSDELGTTTIEGV